MVGTTPCFVRTIISFRTSDWKIKKRLANQISAAIVEDLGSFNMRALPTVQSMLSENSEYLRKISISYAYSYRAGHLNLTDSDNNISHENRARKSA